MCHILIVPWSFWCIINHPINGTGAAYINRSSFHLRWSGTIASIILETLLSLCYKLWSDSPRRSRVLAWVKWHRTRDAYLGVQIFNYVATTCSCVLKACTIKRPVYKVLVLNCRPIAWVNAVIFFCITVEKHFMCNAREDGRACAACKLSVTYALAGS